ncbi:MAG: AbrB/MazE/SpoVT family DNA-binding domain-containing protein [Methanosarcinales archaeon]
MEIKTTVLGERGQIIIPQEIIKDLRLKPNETLMVWKFGNYIVLEKPNKKLAEMLIQSLEKGLKDLSYEEFENERDKENIIREKEFKEWGK